MAGLARLINPEPSKTLAYHTLQADEEARFAHPRSIPHAGRYEPTYPANGNLRLIIPNIDDPQVRDGLPASRRVNTTTRTVFNNDKVYDTHDAISDRVTSPIRLRCSAMKTTGHVTMNTVSATDPRQQHVDMATGVDVGPGSYQTDPCGLPTTAAPSFWEPGQSHHTAPLHKDPSRQSPAFKSPARGKTMDDIAAEKRASSVPFYASHPDYASWQRKGVVLGRSQRKIEAERWGKSIREPRAVLPQPEQDPVEPHISSSSHPTTCEQYIQDASSPKYKVAFSSNLPRLMGVPAGGKASDTRLRCKAQADLYATPPTLGPGSFETDLPRYKSWNVGYQDTQGGLSHVVSPTSPSRQGVSRGSSRSTSPRKSGMSRNSQLMRGASGPVPSHTETPPLTARSQTVASPGCSNIQVKSPTVTSTCTPVISSPFHDLASATSANDHAEGDMHMASSVASPCSLESHHAQPDQEPAIPADVMGALDADWAAHAAAVAEAYTRTDRLRGASTLSCQHLADSIPATPVTLHLPSHLSARSSTAVPSAGRSPKYPSSPALSAAIALPTRTSYGTAETTVTNIESEAGHASELQERLSMACSSPSRSRAGSPGSPFRHHHAMQPSRSFGPGSPATVPLEVPVKLPGDDTLIFLRRSIPHSTQVHTQLKAIADLRTARHDAHESS